MKLDTKQYNISYCFDPSTQLIRQLRSAKLPEVFLFKNVKDSFYLQYRGGIDDFPHLWDNGKHEYYLKDAIDGMLNNTNIKKSKTQAVGCVIVK